jgi:predicted ATPase/class 3 adenylate cyclase
VQKLETLLATFGLSAYAARLSESGVDLRHIADQDLRELGIPFGDRKRILRAIVELGADAIEATASRPAPGERRQVTVMFCDLTNSTALSTRLDPEDLSEVIKAYRATCARATAAYDGYIAQFLGDGILTYFGYPLAHENDAERAVRAGLDIVAAISRLNIPGVERLTARVGIATGVVVAGDLVASDSSQDRTVFGDTPNIAARLQALAKPGAVVISGNTRRLTAGHFEYAELGLLELKGASGPVEAWQVLGPSNIESRFEAEHGRILPPLLGREEEIDLLTRRWRQAVKGDGRVVLIAGEPGIGKSHIVSTFQEQLLAEAHVTMKYFCSSHHTNSALFPFISQIERAAGFERGDTPEAKHAKLAALFEQSPSQIAILANLLSITTDENCFQGVGPQKRKENTLGVFLTRIKSAAAHSPVLIVVEDTHWIDPTSLELLTAIVQQTPKQPLLLVMTSRPEFVPPWPNHAHVTTLPLTRLSREFGAALIDRVTAGKPLPNSVLEKILAQTDGVPLFIEELTKMILESKLLREESGRYVLEQPLPSFAIPTTLYASLMARLDRLGIAKEVAQIGAAVGREFSHELMQAICPFPENTLDSTLAQLVKSELVFCRGEKSDRIYTFRHFLARDVAYAALLKSRRTNLHAAIAKAFEQQFPEVVEAEPESLAHHLSEAGLLEKAVTYWIKAGKKASNRSANLEAIAHLQRGAEAVNGLPEGGAKDRLELDLQFALAPCLIATQGPAGNLAVTTFARAHQLCARLGDAPEYLQVMFWLVTARVVRGELAQALEEIATLTRLAETRKDHSALLNANRGRAMILLFMGRVGESHEEIIRAIEKFDSSDETVRANAMAAGQDAGAAGLALMSWSSWLSGDATQATKHITAALERAYAVDHPHTLAYVSYYAAALFALRGDAHAALQHAQRCLSLSEEHGFVQWQNLARAIRGICISFDRSSAETRALHDVRGAVAEYERAGYALGTTVLHVLWSSALLLNNQPEAALELVELGLSTAEGNGERIFESELYRLKARAVLACASPETDRKRHAEALLQCGIRLANDQAARALGDRAVKDLIRIRTAYATMRSDTTQALFNEEPTGAIVEKLEESPLLHTPDTRGRHDAL